MDILQWNWLFSFYLLFFYKPMPAVRHTRKYQQFHTIFDVGFGTISANVNPVKRPNNILVLL